MGDGTLYRLHAPQSETTGDAGAGARPTQPRPVRIQPVVFTAPHQRLTYSGMLQARHQAELAFRVGGKVVARPVDLGARVRKGDVLARLDPPDLRLQAQAAQNAVEAAADAANARAEAQRYQGLGSASPAYLRSENDKRTAVAAMAAVRLAQRHYALAQSQQDYGALLANADGVVTALPVEMGQVVTAGQTMATVAQTAEIEVLVDVPENRMAAIREARSIAVSPWATASEHCVSSRLGKQGSDKATKGRTAYAAAAI